MTYTTWPWMTPLTFPTTFLLLLTAPLTPAPLPSFSLPIIVSPQVFCMYSPLSVIFSPKCAWLALSFRYLPTYVLIQGSFDHPCKNNIYPFSDPDLMFFIALNLHSKHCTFLFCVCYLFYIFAYYLSPSTGI